MEYITVVLDAPIGSVQKLDKLMAEIGHEPEGLVARYAGTVEGRLGIVGIWDSEADADRFFTQELGPALAKVLGPEPAGLPQEKRLNVEHRYVRNA